MDPLSPRERYLVELGIIDSLTRELTSRGELLAEEAYLGAPNFDDGGSRFSEMGPDVMPGTNVVGP